MRRSKPGRFLYPFTRTNDGHVCARYAFDHIYELLKSNWNHYLFLVPSYIFSITSGIEGEINDAIIGFFISKCGDKYRLFAKPYLRAPFNLKIRQAVLFMSSYRLELDDSNIEVRLLDRLFQLRNLVVHITHYAQPIEIIVDENGSEYAANITENSY